MSVTRHHAEWLSLLEISGPFLSMTVLLKVFPQGLDAHDPEISRGLRFAYEEWDDNQTGKHPNPAVHGQFIRFVLTDVLKVSEETIREGQTIPQTLKTYVPEQSETLKPDVRPEPCAIHSGMRFSGCGDGAVPCALRLRHHGNRDTPDCALQCNLASDGCLDSATVPGSDSNRPSLPIPDSRPRRDLFRRSGPRTSGVRYESSTDASAGTESECLLRTAGRNCSPGVSRFLDSIE